MSDDDTKVPLPDLESGADVQVVSDAGSLAPSDAELGQPRRRRS